MEDTQKLIDEYIAQAEDAPEPEALKVKEVVDKGDTVPEVPVMVDSLKSAGWVYIYDTETADRSVCNKNWLAQQLKKKRPNGKPYFTTIKPAFEPKRGYMKCVLHPDDPQRAHWDELGLPVCRKDNMWNKHGVIQHMKKKHRSEWAVIESERADRERQEDRALQRAILESVAGKQSNEIKCEVCGKTVKNESGLRLHMRSHK